MLQEIHTINLWGSHFIMKGAGGVNSYLLTTGAGHALIDTGMNAKRAALVEELERLGCRPGSLRLIIITHADMDHVGNAAFLRQRYGATIALHREEARAVERMNMALNRRTRQGPVARAILSLISLLGQADRFKADVDLDEGDDLSEYGLDASILHLPGHSAGSIGVLTAGGDLFCGDLLMNVSQPGPQSNIDSAADLAASLDRLERLPIRIVYPGHGKPFTIEQYRRAQHLPAGHAGA